MDIRFKNALVMGSRLFLRIFDYLEKRCFRGAVGALTVCDELTNRAKSLGRASNGSADLPAITATDIALANIGRAKEEEVDKVRQELELGTRAAVIYTGNLKNYQGIALLLAAFALFCTMPNAAPAVLVMVGGGPEESEEKMNYRRLANKLRLADKVRWVGVKPLEEMAAYCAVADVLVSPRLSGSNTPLKIYSYLAAAKPVVATNISSHTQVIDDSSAFLCEPNEQSMAEALMLALDNSAFGKQVREQKIAQGLRLIETTFSEDQFQANIRWLYENTRGV